MSLLLLLCSPFIMVYRCDKKHVSQNIRYVKYPHLRTSQLNFLYVPRSNGLLCNIITQICTWTEKETSQKGAAFQTLGLGPVKYRERYRACV